MRRYFKNNNDYFKFINKYKNEIEIIKVYYTSKNRYKQLIFPTKICIIYTFI